MNDSQFLALAWTQLIQVSVLIAVVWLLVKLFARQRPHLAHALWLLVLVKCLTPPMMSSPTGVLTQIPVPEVPWERFLLRDHPTEEPDVLHAVVEPEPEPQIEHIPEPWEPETESVVVDDLSRGFVVDESEFPPELLSEEPEPQIADTQPIQVISEEAASPPTRTISSTRLWKSWLTSAGILLLLTLVRVLITLRRVYRHRVTVPAELEFIVARLSKQLRLRRKVRILVTASKVGPAVVGFFRPILILPQVVTQGRSPQELEPIIAHELLHVKRGDLGIGWLQVLTQSLWWFHPFVWLANRFLNREAERCCDEAVVAELDCSPAVYARCLLNVLEQKRNLTPIPACPGVKPVDLTKQRMERIMNLGQGCRKRTPWWCWLIVVLLGLIVLPGRGESETIADETPKESSALIYQDARFYHESSREMTVPNLSDLELQAYSQVFKKVEMQLAQDADVLYRETPLTHVMLHIHQETGVPIELDHVRFEHAEKSPDSKIELQLSGVNWSTILAIVLESNKLGFCIIPVYDKLENEYRPKLYVTTKGQVVDLSLALRARSIPVICAPDDFHAPKQTPTRKKIQNVLNKPCDLQFNADSLSNVLKSVANAAGITVYLDGPSLVVGGIEDVGAISINHQSEEPVRLRDLLDKILSPHRLIYVIEDEVLRIMNEEAHLNKVIIDRYDWKDLAPENFKPTRENLPQLIEHVKDSFAPDTWENSKEFRIVPHESQETLFIRHRRRVHEEMGRVTVKNSTVKDKTKSRLMIGQGVNSDASVIERSDELDNFRVSQGGGLRLQIPPMGPVQPVSPPPWSKHTWAWLKQTPPWKKYDREISVSFEGIPLKQAIEQICAAGDLNFLNIGEDENPLDRISQIKKTGYPHVTCVEYDLEEKATVLATPVTFSAENKAAIPILEDILKQFGLGLGYLNGDNGNPRGCFDIRTKDFLDRTRWTVVYPVGDLLKHDNNLQSGPTRGVPILDKIPHQNQLFKAKPKTNADLADVLIEVLEKALAWDHSEANIATGTMKYRESSEALVILCHRDQHELIAKLLHERRKACGLEIGSYLRDDVQYSPPTPLSPKDGPGPSVMPSLTPSPRESDTVQLRFLGPEKSHLTFLGQDRLKPTHQLVLPGRLDLAPGKKYLMTLENIPGKSIKSDWPVDFVHDPKFHWRLEIPEGNERTNGYLQHNSIPLKFTEEDLNQLAANNSVTKVVYLPHPDTQKLAIGSVETLVSTQLKPDVDPIEEAKKRGTILAVLRSHNGNLMIGTGVENEAGVSGSLILDESQFDDGPQQPHKPDDNDQKPFLTKVYPVADLVVPIPQIDIPQLDIPPAVDWGKPITGTPISIPGPPHLPLDGAAKAAIYPSPQAGDLALRAQHPAKAPSMKSTPAPKYDASPLIELITQTMKDAQDQKITEGTKLVFVQETLSLVVRASQPDHEIIAELLTGLRRKQDVQVTLECMTVQFSEDSFPQFWADGKVVVAKTVDASVQNSKNPLIFHNVDRDGFKSNVKTCAQAEVISLPKLTVFNGVGAQVQISGAMTVKDHVENMHYMIVPTVSEDRRKIDVKFAVNPTSTIDALSKAKSMTIPDGNSVLIEVTDELLSSLRGTATLEVDKALRALKKKELGVRTFVLLTPKIIIQEEEEEALPPRPIPTEDLNAPLRLQVSRKNPPDWVVPIGDSYSALRTVPMFVSDNQVMIAAGNGTHLNFLNAANGETVREYSEPGLGLGGIRMSPDRRRIAYATYQLDEMNSYPNSIVVRQLPSLELVGTPLKIDFDVYSDRLKIAISSTGKYVAAGSQNLVTVWNVESGKQLARSTDSFHRFDALEFAPDDQSLLISHRNSISRWQWQGEESLQTVSAGRLIKSFAFTPDNQLFFTGPDSHEEIEVRDLQTLKVVRRIRDNEVGNMTVGNMHLLSDGKTLVAGNSIAYDWRALIVNDRLHFWDIETGNIFRKFDFTRHEVSRVAVSPDGRYLVATLEDLNKFLIAGWDLQKDSTTQQN